MPDIDRRGAEGDRFHNVHQHTCPNCHRNYSCNCYKQDERQSLVCTDCEQARYNPVIHGGTGEREEA